MHVYLVHYRNLNTRSENSRHMQFGCFVDEAGDFIDTVHFPNVAARYRFNGTGVYLIKGKVLQDYDFINIETYSMERLEYVDFHEV